MTEGRILAIPEETREKMRDVCWHRDPRCPSFDELALLHVPFRGFDGRDHTGELVVAKEAAEAVLWALERIHAARYPIERMERIERYDGDDRRSMAANNSSGFNFRTVDGEERLSRHARGLAVDLNPVFNPWIRGDRVDPEAGRKYVGRDATHPAIIRRGDPVTRAFDAIGWQWGGDWTSYQDYHHFEAP